MQFLIRSGATAVMMVSALTVAFGAESAVAKDLQWRRAQTPVSKSTSSKSASSKRTTAAISPRLSKADASAPKARQPMRDSAIQLAAFEDEGAGLQLTDASSGQASLKSVVVNSDGEESIDFRAAQLPTESDSTTNAPPNGSSRYEEELRTPFGTGVPQETTPQDTTPPGATDVDPLFDEPATREIESVEELDVESMPLPESDDTQLRTNGQEQSPADRARSTFQTPSQLPNDDRPPSTFEPTYQLPNDDRLPVGPDGRPLPTVPTTTNELAEERERTMGICSEELQELKTSTLHDVDLAIGIAGTEGEDFPFECTIDDGTWHDGRSWDQITYMWKASALCHKPLYFENEQLERYGHSWGPCLDPLVSGAHFFTRLPVLPYCMGVEPPHECVYALGHYRPGSCAPYMINPVPLSARGAVFQGGAVVGAAAILP